MSVGWTKFKTSQSSEVEHKPFAEKECKILLIEPAGTLNTGDAGGDMTAEDNVWPESV